jgi:hypothetical protein
MFKDIFLIIIGAAIGLCSTLFVEHKKRVREEYQRRDRGKQLLKAILEEVKIGIERCSGLSQRLNKQPPEISFSRVYTGLWDAAIPELSKSIDDLEIIRLLNQSYYYFDLVNFNMNRNEFGVGAAFAKDKLPYLHENYAELERKLNAIPDKVILNTPTIDKIVTKIKQIYERIFKKETKV